MEVDQLAVLNVLQASFFPALPISIMLYWKQTITAAWEWGY